MATRLTAAVVVTTGAGEPPALPVGRGRTRATMWTRIHVETCHLAVHACMV